MSDIRITPYLVFKPTEVFERIEEHLIAGTTDYFQSIQSELIIAIHSHMREWRGDEKRNVKSILIEGQATRLIIYGDLIQTFVDEFGLLPQRAFPPFGPSSILRQWVRDKLKPIAKPVKRSRVSPEKRQENAEATVTFLVARAIHSRGITAGSPFAKAFQEKMPEIMVGLNKVASTVAAKINGIA